MGAACARWHFPLPAPLPSSTSRTPPSFPTPSISPHHCHHHLSHPRSRRRRRCRCASARRGDIARACTVSLALRSSATRTLPFIRYIILNFIFNMHHYLLSLDGVLSAKACAKATLIDYHGSLPLCESFRFGSLGRSSRIPRSLRRIESE